MQKLSGAVIGIKGIGKWHGKMMQDTERMDVVALCDVDEAQKEAGLKEFPNARFYTSHTTMLEKEKLDLVGVITPHNLHAPLSIDALNAGANVIVEKPMATRHEDCLAVMRTARERDRFVTVFHNRRLDPWFLAARDVIAEGLLGDLIEIHIGIAYAPSTATWRGFKDASGGLMFDWGCHLVDYALGLDTSEVQAVSGHLYRAPGLDATLNETHGTLRIHFESGAVANVTVSAADQHHPERFKIVGTRGTLLDDWKWGDEDKLQVHAKLGGGEAAAMEIAYRKSRMQDLYDSITGHLLDGAPLMVSPESAARVINVLCTAERSAGKGGIPMPLE